MNAFARRRRIGLSILLLLAVIGWGALQALDASLRSTHFWSGWLLLGLIVALALFNLRKKLPFLPLGSATGWMEFHVYAGLFSILVFLSHVDFGWPTGALDWSLAGLFALVAGSGVVGLVLTRLLPHRLNTRGDAILFERIPALRLALHREVEELVLQSAREVQTTTIGEFYTARLADYFARPRNLLAHWIDSTGRFRNLERELWALDRYANDREREILSEIHERMCLKEDLDYRWAQGVALKGWLFFHLPLTYAFLLAIAAHVLLVYGFHGGLR